MKKRPFLGFVLIALCVLILPACGSKKPQLHIYTWADYIKPELIEAFEKAHGCDVIVDTFESNESMFAKLHLGGSGYDLIVPSNYFLEVMNQKEMLQPINRAALPNLQYLDPALLTLVDEKMLAVGVPYMMTPTGIAWRKDRIHDMQESWSVFGEQSAKGRMTMLNDPREAMGAALKFLGYSVNTPDLTELEKAKQQLIVWKKNLAKFESEQYKNGIASGEYLIVQGYSGDILQVMSENDAVDFCLPQEGTTTSIDFLVIPKQAKEVALAHEFINYLYEPEVAKENMDFTCYICPHTVAIEKVNVLLKNLVVPFLNEEHLKTVELIHDLGPLAEAYNKAWDEVKAAKG